MILNFLKVQMTTKMVKNSFQIFVCLLDSSVPMCLLDSSVPMYFPALGTPNACICMTRRYLGNLPLFPNTIPPLVPCFWEALLVRKTHWAREVVEEGGRITGEKLRQTRKSQGRSRIISQDNC